MKKVEVFTLVMDALLEDYNSSHSKRIIDSWFDSEEYKFLERNSVSIEFFRIPNHDRFEIIFSFYAIMDEQIETYWRLKFK